MSGLSEKISTPFETMIHQLDVRIAERKFDQAYTDFKLSPADAESSLFQSAVHRIAEHASLAAERNPQQVEYVLQVVLAGENSKGFLGKGYRIASPDRERLIAQEADLAASLQRGRAPERNPMLSVAA